MISALASRQLIRYWAVSRPILFVSLIVRLSLSCFISPTNLCSPPLFFLSLSLRPTLLYCPPLPTLTFSHLPTGFLTMLKANFLGLVSDSFSHMREDREKESPRVFRAETEFLVMCWRGNTQRGGVAGREGVDSKREWEMKGTE